MVGLHTSTYETSQVCIMVTVCSGFARSKQLTNRRLDHVDLDFKPVSLTANVCTAECVLGDVAGPRRSLAMVRPTCPVVPSGVPLFPCRCSVRLRIAVRSIGSSLAGLSRPLTSPLQCRGLAVPCSLILPPSLGHDLPVGLSAISKHPSTMDDQAFWASALPQGQSISQEQSQAVIRVWCHLNNASWSVLQSTHPGIPPVAFWREGDNTPCSTGTPP